MENKIKAILAVLLTFGVTAFIAYQVIHNAQFIGILLMSMGIIGFGTMLYVSYYEYLKVQKWKGEVPTTVLGSNGSVLLNLK
jgi:hypothetical protein